MKKSFFPKNSDQKAKLIEKIGKSNSTILNNLDKVIGGWNEASWDDKIGWPESSFDDSFRDRIRP